MAGRTFYGNKKTGEEEIQFQETFQQHEIQLQSQQDEQQEKLQQKEIE